MRLGGDVPKALVPLAGRPMLLWSVEALRASDRVDEIVVLAPAGREDEMRDALGPLLPDERVTAGGASRAESVREGVRAVSPRAAADPGARRGAPAGVGRADRGGARPPWRAWTARSPPCRFPTRSSGRREDERIAGTVDRAGLWGAQTPQAFWADPLRAAITAAEAQGRLADATDCASLIEAVGGAVRLVASLEPNLKVTTPADARLAAALLTARQ